MGLHRAGFTVVGVDIQPQPRYPFTFVQADAMKVLSDAKELRKYDLIWASPPCQAFTAYRRRPNHVPAYPNLIPDVRSWLRAANVPWIIENIPGAPLFEPVQLCGSSFGLDVRRHRLFETCFEVRPLACNHRWQTPRFKPASNRTNLRCTVEVGVWRIPLDVQSRAMGIDWMNREELSEAIPPAYSQYLAEQFKLVVSG
jgi:DNA (cytosine-5)-methyltransferase 1